MSDKTTMVSTSAGGLMLWGHVAPEEAIAQLKRHAVIQLEEARQHLADIARGEVVVEHRRGVHVARGVVKVWPL